MLKQTHVTSVEAVGSVKNIFSCVYFPEDKDKDFFCLRSCINSTKAQTFNLIFLPVSPPGWVVSEVCVTWGAFLHQGWGWTVESPVQLPGSSASDWISCWRGCCFFPRQLVMMVHSDWWPQMKWDGWRHIKARHRDQTERKPFIFSLA